MCEIVVLSGTNFLPYCISFHISFQKQPILKQKKRPILMVLCLSIHLKCCNIKKMFTHQLVII